MVWFGISSKGVCSLRIFGEGTVDHERYIQEVLPLVLKFGKDMFGDKWTFEQDGGRAHIHQKTEDCCRTDFRCLIDKDHWPRNSPGLNALDCCIWDKFARAINWDLVTSKTTLINKLKRAVKKIRCEVVFQSCASSINRLYRLKQRLWQLFNEINLHSFLEKKILYQIKKRKRKIWKIHWDIEKMVKPSFFMSYPQDIYCWT